MRELKIVRDMFTMGGAVHTFIHLAEKMLSVQPSGATHHDISLECNHGDRGEHPGQCAGAGGQGHHQDWGDQVSLQSWLAVNSSGIAEVSSGTPEVSSGEP